jgi:putative ABC transport system substrate-binding protein
MRVHVVPEPAVFDLRRMYRKQARATARQVNRARHHLALGRVGTRRRDLLGFIGCAILAAKPVPAQQQSPVRVIGFLSAGSRDAFFDFDSFRQGLAEPGYVEGKNVAIEYRWADDRFDRLPGLAAELVERKVDVIFSSGGVPAARAAKNATTTIPIVFIVGVDPVARGLVESLAHPGGNITGLTVFGPELNQKRLELLTELVPSTRLIAFLLNPTNPANVRTVEGLSPGVQALGQAKGVRFEIVLASAETEFDAAFKRLVELKVDALLIGADPLFYNRVDQLAELALRYSVPAIHDWRKFTDGGGLISYGSDLPKIVRETGVYIGRILNGAKAGELPVLQPTKFELVINGRTAKALGLTIPPAILARADEVIE